MSGSVTIMSGDVTIVSGGVTIVSGGVTIVSGDVTFVSGDKENQTLSEHQPHCRYFEAAGYLIISTCGALVDLLKLTIWGNCSCLMSINGLYN